MAGFNILCYKHTSDGCREHSSNERSIVDEEIELTTHTFPWVATHVVRSDVVCVEYRLHDKDQFEGAKEMLRERAKELEGNGVIGISFQFPDGGVRAIGTVVRIMP